MPIRLNNNLPTSYQEFIHLSRYSRWLEDKGRRETWTEDSPLDGLLKLPRSSCRPVAVATR